MKNIPPIKTVHMTRSRYMTLCSKKPDSEFQFEGIWHRVIGRQGNGVLTHPLTHRRGYALTCKTEFKERKQ